MHQKKKKQIKEVENYRTLYFQFIIQFKLHIDDQMIHLKESLLIPILLLSFLQTTSFIFQNYFFSNSEHNGFRHFYMGISMFTRPYLLMQNKIEATGFMIPLALIATLEISGLYLFFCFLQNKKKRVSSIINEQKRTFQILVQIFAYIQQLQYYIFIIPFQELTINSIKYYSQNNSFSLAGLTFAILGFLSIISNLLFYQICIQQSIHIKTKNLNMLVQSLNHFLNPVFSMLFIFFNTFEQNSRTIKFYIIAIIIIIKSLFNIYSIYSTLQNPKRRSIIEILFETLQLSFASILTFIELSKFKSESEDYETELILIISPLTSLIIIIIFNLHHKKILLNQNQLSTSSILLYRISSVLEEFGEIRNSYIQENEKITILIYLKSLHIQNCSATKCICSQQSLTFQQILQLYLKDQVNHFSNSINKIKQQGTRQFYFLHYLSLIHYLGLSTKAFQQSNIVVYQESDNYSSSLSKAKSGLRIPTANSQQEKQNSSAQKSQIESKQEEILQIKVGSFTTISKQRLLIIQENIKRTMSQGLGKKDDQIFSDNLEHAVKLFLKAEENNQQLKHKIMKTINKKKDFFLNLSVSNNNFRLFEQAKVIISKMTQLEDQLLKLYTQFPSRKMQALNTFYQSEVMNNYFQAYKLATVTSISDEKLLKMQSQLSFDLFSNKIDYLIVGFEEKNHKLAIRQSSNQIHEFFGIPYDKFKILQSLDHFLPSNFEQTHSKLVQNFLQSGTSKFFRQINANFCRYQFKFIKSIDFFFDINVTNLSDLTFACFMQEIEAQNAFIFCGHNEKIENISKNLIVKLGYSQKLSQQLFDQLKKQCIKRIFPKLQVSQENLTKFSIEQEDTDQEIINYSEYSVQMHMPDEESLIRHQQNCWDNEQNLQLFQVDVIYHSRKIKSDCQSDYSFIEIREAKKFNKTFSTPNQTEFINLSQKISLSQQQEIQEFDDNLEWLDDQESNINPPRAIEFDIQEDIPRQIDEESSDLRFGKKVQENQKNQSQSFYPNISLISPKDAALKLIDSKIAEVGGFYDSNTKRNIEARQQFFSAVNQKEISSEAQSDYQQAETNKHKDQNCIEKLQMEDIDKELQDNIIMQMQLESQNQNIAAVDDIGSQVSSVAAFKKSKYSKKYDLIQKLIVSQKFSIYFYEARIFYFILLLLFVIFSIIEIVFSSDDLNRFLQELDMVQIKSNIIAPIDNYIVAQNAVMFYAIRALIGMMSHQMASEKLVYSQNDITYNYEELKASYIKQLSNQYLNPFFQDKNFTIIQSMQTTTSDRNVSAREALYISLEAAYQFVLLDYQNIFTSLDATSGFFVYLFGNYQTFYEQLTIVNQDMLAYSVNRSILVRQKWLTLMIPTLVIGFILLGITIKFHQLYLQQYDQFLALFSYIEIVWLQRDIDRYKGITNLVQKDSDVLFKYQFDIDLKEKFLAAEDIRKEKIAQNQKSHKQKAKATTLALNQKTKKLPSLIIYSIVYIVCFSLCIMSTNFGQSYVEKYAETTNFFNTLCDISTASTGVFSQRQIIYAVESTASSAFFFIKNPQFFVDVFYDHIQRIEDFLALMTQFHPQNLITSDYFVEKIQSLMSDDICTFLPSYKIQSAQIHCDAVYGGVVRRGLTATLSTVRSALLNEFQTSNNFTIQSYSLNEELEIALISYDAISNVRLQFQTELIQFTQSLIETILVINICSILIYLLSMIIYYFSITKIYYNEFRQVLKFILLMPQTSLFLDNQLDRNLKQLILKNDLI